MRRARVLLVCLLIVATTAGLVVWISSGPGPSEPVTVRPHTAAWPGVRAGSDVPLAALLSRLDGSVLAGLDVKAARRSLNLPYNADPISSGGSGAGRRLRLLTSILVSFLPPRRKDPVSQVIDLGRVQAMATSYTKQRPFPAVMLLATTQPTSEIARRLQEGGYTARRDVLEWSRGGDDSPVRFVSFGPGVVLLARERHDLERTLTFTGAPSRLASTLLGLHGTLRVGREIPGFCVQSVAFSEELSTLRGTLSLNGSAVTSSRVAFGDQGKVDEATGTDLIRVLRVRRRPHGYAVDYDYKRAGASRTPAPLLLLDPPPVELLYRCPGPGRDR